MIKHGNLLLLLLGVLVSAGMVSGQQNQRRNRGESFFWCRNSNTLGPGNIWVSLSGTGYMWDDAGVEESEETGKEAFVKKLKTIGLGADIRIQGGITDFLSLQAGVRPVFRQEWAGGGIKLTWPDNQELRMHGVGCSIDYRYQIGENAPTIGGFNGFMPEGFVVKGHNLSMLFIYELDLTSKFSFLPLRVIANAGLRQPLSKRKEMRQFLINTGIVYSGYGFDFYAQYNLESFDNMGNPKIVQDDLNKSTRFAVWFSENPMYVTLGGNMRYDNGITLSLAVPILLSVNRGSRKTREDQVELDRNIYPERFVFEKANGINDPFDPWYAKWRIVGSLMFPIRFKMTGAEMMRNYLMLKNRKQEKKIDIDSRIRSGEKTDGREGRKGEAENKEDQEDTKRRLEEIRKKREEILK